MGPALRAPPAHRGWSFTARRASAGAWPRRSREPSNVDARVAVHHCAVRGHDEQCGGIGTQRRDDLVRLLPGPVFDELGRGDARACMRRSGFVISCCTLPRPAPDVLRLVPGLGEHLCSRPGRVFAAARTHGPGPRRRSMIVWPAGRGAKLCERAPHSGNSSPWLARRPDRSDLSADVGVGCGPECYQVAERVDLGRPHGRFPALHAHLLRRRSDAGGPCCARGRPDRRRVPRRQLPRTRSRRAGSARGNLPAAVAAADGA